MFLDILGIRNASNSLIATLGLSNFLLLILVTLSTCKPSLQTIQKTNSKLSQELIILNQEYQLALDSGKSPNEFTPSNEFLNHKNGLIRIELISKTEGDLLIQSLNSFDLRDVQVYRKIVNCNFPIEKLEELEEVQQLHFARAVFNPSPDLKKMNNAKIKTRELRKKKKSTL